MDKKKNINKNKDEETPLHFWVSTVLYAIIMVGIVVLLKSFIISNDQVSGPSMQPTFEDKDRIVALRHSSIKRGDVVVLEAPDQKDTLYIKRVIGMPGDTVESKNDKVYVNGKKFDQPFLDNKFKKEANDSGLLYTNNFTLKTLAQGPYYQSIYQNNPQLLEKVEKDGKVPSGQYFVMGDHRDVSKDGRMIGFIKKDAIVGVVKLRYWPLNAFKTF